LLSLGINVLLCFIVFLISVWNVLVGSGSGNEVVILQEVLYLVSCIFTD
jgi:hypothetical protein